MAASDPLQANSLPVLERLITPQSVIRVPKSGKSTPPVKAALPVLAGAAT
jgi:hypothetical protein